MQSMYISLLYVHVIILSKFFELQFEFLFIMNVVFEYFKM